MSVFRSSDIGDCSNGGVTAPENAKGKIFCVFDPELRSGNYLLANVIDDPRVVCLVLVRRSICGEEYIHAEPLRADNDRRHRSAGGNFVFTSDSRFRQVCPYPIAVHDRHEG